MMIDRDVDHQFFSQERSEADKWPVRRNDLEAAIRNLQITGFASQVQRRLDDSRSELGPVEGQDDSDRLWRLALHRMDMREYQLADKADTPEEFIGKDSY